MKWLTAFGLVVGLVMTGCSSFNMLADCGKTGAGFAPSMIVPSGGRPDRARLDALISVSVPQELSAGYNQRTCRADMTALGETHTVSYTVRQSEGVQDWGEYTMSPEPEVQNFIVRVRQAYAG